MIIVYIDYATVVRIFSSNRDFFGRNINRRNVVNTMTDLVKKQLDILEDALYLIKELIVEIAIILKENSHLAKRQLSLLKELIESMVGMIAKLAKGGK